MQFKEFITRQRVAVCIVGIATFIISLLIANTLGLSTLGSELFIDLAASSVTIIFTALIIDYLGLKEQRDRTQNVANLAKDEVRATCYRINWRLARLFGLERANSGRDNISNHQEAMDYLNLLTSEVSSYLLDQDLLSSQTPVITDSFQSYLDRLQSAQVELEQTLVLYEYALSYGLREKVLALRSELQLAERLLNFIDVSEPFNKANLSLIRVTASSVYDAVEAVLNSDLTTEDKLFS